MMPPTSIDGTDITGATIDGTDVQEITVDGQTVFTAATRPVAYSNLVAWYPFDSATYGGSNADDVTALFNPAQSGDSTAYDGTVSGATYQPSGGGTDINAGANAGAFDFEKSGNDRIETTFGENLTNYTLMGWVNVDDVSGRDHLLRNELGGAGDAVLLGTRDGGIEVNNFAAGVVNIGVGTVSSGTWHHIAMTSETKGYIDGGSPVVSDSSGALPNPRDFVIGGDVSGGGFMDGKIDDVRIYNTDLTSTQIDQIITNTPHP